MQEVIEEVEEVVETVEEAKKLSVRFRDLIVRLFVRIGKLITCNKITIKSSCCEHVDNHTETHNTNIYNTPPQEKRRLKQ